MSNEGQDKIQLHTTYTRYIILSLPASYLLTVRQRARSSVYVTSMELNRL
jgi:hypothetical protein